MSRIRVLIADDQELFAAGVRIILEAHGSGEIEVVGIAADGRQAVDMVERDPPDLVLMDVRMPVMDGVEATRLIHERHPEVRILILTTFDDDDYVHTALGGGAVGYLLKNLQPDELVSAVRAAYRGTFLVSPAVGRKLVRQAHEGASRAGQSDAHYHGELNFLRAHFRTLSKREAEVLSLILQDLDNREIAERLGIAEQTVKNYTSIVYEKLDVTDRIHAIRLVKELRG